MRGGFVMVGLAGLAGLFDVTGASDSISSAGYAFSHQNLRLGGGSDVHGDIVNEFIVATDRVSPCSDDLGTTVRVLSRRPWVPTRINGGKVMFLYRSADEAGRISSGDLPPTVRAERAAMSAGSFHATRRGTNFSHGDRSRGSSITSQFQG